MNADSLYAVFIEARNKDERVQWVAFPRLDYEIAGQDVVKFDHDDTRVAFMKRRLSGSKSRSVWKFFNHANNDPLHAQLVQYGSTEWTIIDPVVVKLHLDDYQRIWGRAPHQNKWSPSTPYKVLRHIEKVTVQQGYRLTGAPGSTNL